MRQPFELHRTKLANGIELNVVDEGPRDAPAMIFLHGFPESHWTWRNQIPHFSDRYRVIAPDQRGYCKSDKPDGAENYTPDKLALDVFLLADALGIEKFTVVGHDWGGALAWIVALMASKNGPEMFQGRVERLIIANAPHPYIFQRLLFDDMEQRAASQYIRGFRNPDNDELIRTQGIPGILMKEIGWAGSDALTDQDKQIYFRDWSEPGAAFSMLNWYRGSTVTVPATDEENPARPPMLDASVPPITMPTLVIWATDDKALPPCNLEGMEDVIPDLEIVKVEGCGHFVPWEAPDDMNRAMDAWLASH